MKNLDILNIYVANLGLYNEGELVGSWIQLPVDDEEIERILKEIGINDGYEEWFIADFEKYISDIEVSEYSNIYELNELVRPIADIVETEEELDILNAIIDITGDLDSALIKLRAQDYAIYDNCISMEDVAEQVVEETGLLHGIPAFLANFFDYEAFGRYLEYDNYVYIGKGRYIYVM